MNRRKLIAAVMGGAPLPWYRSGGVPLANVIAAYDAKNAASKEASLLSLTGSNDLVENGTVAWDATGWTDWSTSNYFTGSFNLSTNYSYVIRYTGATIGLGNFSRILYVKDAATQAVSIIPFASDGNAYFTNNNVYWTNPREAAGIIIVTPTKCYFNGVDLGASDGVGGGTYTGTQWKIGLGFAVSTTFPGKVLAISVYNIDLSPVQVSAINTQVAAL